MNEDIMRAAGFGKEVDRTKFKLCPLCGLPIKMEDFKNPFAIKEYGISGICQACQDSIWG